MFSRKYVLHKRKWPGAWERAMAKNVERAVKPRRQLARISVPMLSSRVRGFNSQAFLPMASICFSVSPSGTRCCLFYSRPLKYTHLFSLSACLLLPHTLAAYKSDTQCLPTRVQISLAGSHAIRVAEKLIRFKGSAQFPRFLWDLSYPAAVSFCRCFFTTTYLWLIVYIVYRLRFFGRCAVRIFKICATWLFIQLEALLSFSVRLPKKNNDSCPKWTLGRIKRMWYICLQCRRISIISLCLPRDEEERKSPIWNFVCCC